MANYLSVQLRHSIDSLASRGWSIRRKLARVLGALEEGGLGDFLGQLRRAHLPQRGGMDKIEMAADDFREGILGPMPGVERKQFQIGVAHVQKDNGTGRGNPP